MTAKFIEAMKKMPPRHYLRLYLRPSCSECVGEPNQYGLLPLDAGGLWALLIEEPPDGGWETRGERFAHGPEYADYDDPAEPYEFDEACRSGVNTAPDDPRFWDLVADMIENQAAKWKPLERELDK